jgi:DNA polymerase-3 subunit alpha
MPQQQFSCGCVFEHNEKGPILDINDIRYDCPATWNLFKQGLTKGIFQLESQLGRHWSKEVGPDTLEELSAIIAIMRPGVLESKMDGVSLTQLYADRKNKKREVIPYHPALDIILGPTYGILVYQEQAMEIARVVCGFSLQEADMLRKAIGKKKPEEMAKIKIVFLEKAAATKILTQEQAEEVFGWIEKSQRYSFNHSHSIAYAMDGYWSAFAKAHFPVHFFTSYLYFAHEKQFPSQEIRELINEMKLFDIPINLPKFTDLQESFYTDGKSVTYGISDIKGIGEAIYTKLINVANDVEHSLKKPIKEWTWYEFLTQYSHKVNSLAVNSMISAGALDYNISRNEMLYEFNKWTQLTELEQDWVISQGDRFSNLTEALSYARKTKKEGGGASNVKRAATVEGLFKLLQAPPMSLKDEPVWIAVKEEQMLSAPITFHVIDGCDISQCNCNCREFLSGRTGVILLAAEIKGVREVVTKNGKNPGNKMAFLTIEDGSCGLDNVVIFPEAYKTFYNILQPKQTVLIKGERDQKKGSLIVQKLWAI